MRMAMAFGNATGIMDLVRPVIGGDADVVNLTERSLTP